MNNMIQNENGQNRFRDLLIPVWSHQHGAYITLITGWLVGTLLSETVSRIHGAVFIFLMAGLNFGELVQEYLKKKLSVSLRKQAWIILYGFLTMASCFYLLQNSISFNFIFPVLVALGVVYIYLSLKREHKHIFSELLAFAAIALGGLMAFEPQYMPGIEFLELWVLLTCYFGTSVFLVKARFDKVTWKETFLYFIVCVILTAAIMKISVIFFSILFLIAFKLLTVLLAESWYKNLRITTIGFMECGYCLILVTVLVTAH